MPKRNRGMALSEEGAMVVMTEYYKQGFTQERWAFKGYTSLSTVKRLIKRERVEVRCLYSLLNALGLEVQESFIQRQTENTQSAVPPENNLRVDDQPGVFMTATFTEDKRPQIERVLRHLRQLLIGSEVTFSESGESVTISGDFYEQDRKHIEMTITQLEKLFTSCRVTW